MGARGGPDRWRWVGWSMAAGSAYDAVFGAAILLAKVPSSRLLGLDLPEDPVYLNLVGVLLLLLAAIYALAAREPERYRGVVGAAAAGRLAGAVVLLSAWVGGEPRAFAALAAGDLLFAVLHAVLLARAGSLAPRAPRPSA